MNPNDFYNKEAVEALFKASTEDLAKASMAELGGVSELVAGNCLKNNCRKDHVGSNPTTPTNMTEYNRAYYYKRRQKIIDYLGGKCISCGSPENLQFDHVDPKKKLFNIKDNLTLESIISEVNKCQLLCNFCHIKKTNEEKKSFTHGTMYAWMKKKCSCGECYRARRLYHRERNRKRRKGKGYKERF